MHNEPFFLAPQDSHKQVHLQTFKKIPIIFLDFQKGAGFSTHLSTQFASVTGQPNIPFTATSLSIPGVSMGTVFDRPSSEPAENLKPRLKKRFKAKSKLVLRSKGSANFQTLREMRDWSKRVSDRIDRGLCKLNRRYRKIMSKLDRKGQEESIARSFQ